MDRMVVLVLLVDVDNPYVLVVEKSFVSATGQNELY
jgi:hypothetical protein